MIFLIVYTLYGFARQVSGETRVGFFASRAIKIGEPLTYECRYFKQFILLFCKEDMLS
jgi:hypothetical protein